MKQVLIASSNWHKVQEIREILAGLAVEWRTIKDFPEFTEVAENGKSYAENARLKADAWVQRTGLWTLADDSGLEVEALLMRPGIHSARYAPTSEKRIERMLTELKDVPAENRGARFIAVAVLLGPEGTCFAMRGELEGRISFEPRGVGGFGYDPIFVPHGFDGRHLAELSAPTKNQISHRALAMLRMRPILEALAADIDLAQFRKK